MHRGSLLSTPTPLETAGLDDHNLRQGQVPKSCFDPPTRPLAFLNRLDLWGCMTSEINIHNSFTESMMIVYIARAFLFLIGYYRCSLVTMQLLATFWCSMERTVATQTLYNLTSNIELRRPTYRQCVSMNSFQIQPQHL